MQRWMPGLLGGPSRGRRFVDKETHPSVWDKYWGSQHLLCRVSERRGVLLSLVTVRIAGKSWTDAGCVLLLRVLRVDMSFVCCTKGVESWTDVGLCPVVAGLACGHEFCVLYYRCGKLDRCRLCRTCCCGSCVWTWVLCVVQQVQDTLKTVLPLLF